MPLPRFYIPPERWNPGDLALEGNEAHHCAQVMRRTTGDEIVAFNGAGEWTNCRITEASRHRVALVSETPRSTPRPAVHIALLQAIPKAGNMELIIEKAVELGVAAIHPVFTSRTVVKFDPKDAAKKREKWQRLALETCKQCGQNWLPEIHLPQSFETAWRALPGHDLRLIAAIQEDARPLKLALSSVASGNSPRPSSLLIAIGPEGDFSSAEYALARQNGCLPVSLGPIVLRVETATLFCLSVLSYELHPAKREGTE